jgi:hypothetical protein
MSYYIVLSGITLTIAYNFNKIINFITKFVMVDNSLDHDDGMIKLVSLESLENLEGRLYLNKNKKLHLENWLNYIYCLNAIRPSDIVDKYGLIDIVYTYGNKTYSIIINDDFHKHIQNDIKQHLKRDIIDAVITKDYDSMNITKYLKKFIGPNHDFHKSLNNNNNTDLNNILHNLNLDYWDHIFITDTFGDTTKINLYETKFLDWNPNFI